MIWKKSNDTLIKLISGTILGGRSRGEMINININVRIVALHEKRYFTKLKKLSKR